MFSLEHIIQIVLKHYYEYVMGNSRFQKIELGSKLNRIQFACNSIILEKKIIFWSLTIASSVLQRCRLKDHLITKLNLNVWINTLFIVSKHTKYRKEEDKFRIVLMVHNFIHVSYYSWIRVPSFWNRGFSDTISIGDIRVKLLQCGSSLLFLDFYLS